MYYKGPTLGQTVIDITSRHTAAVRPPSFAPTFG
jgi:hypothetical protein